jgi:hypothetical protein
MRELEIINQSVGSTEIYLSNGFVLELRLVAVAARETGKKLPNGFPEIHADFQHILNVKVAETAEPGESLQ